MHRLRDLLGLCAALALASGCYQYVPMATTAPAPGRSYTFEISDQGRVALGDRLGPGVLKVEGTLVGQSEGAYLVRVASIETIDGGTSHWGGEQVPVRADYVSRMQRREFSTGRTAVAIGAAAAALGAFIVSRGLSAPGGGPTSTSSTGSPSGS